MRPTWGVPSGTTVGSPAAARAALAAWDTPVLVLASGVDSGPRPRVVVGIAELFGRAEPVVRPNNAGHCPWLDGPRRFARTVEAFLAQGRGGPAVRLRRRELSRRTVAPARSPPAWCCREGQAMIGITASGVSIRKVNA
ncbi:alpha/beta fold hydrolase [Streptomyces sp. NPDC058092]|uniref:alpha/beta fold hydrolase n=1 Tax=Streptomyces sp. NPDC058092 TaxID=3346336 RepID=UPI0036E85B63